LKLESNDEIESDDEIRSNNGIESNDEIESDDEIGSNNEIESNDELKTNMKLEIVYAINSDCFIYKFNSFTVISEVFSIQMYINLVLIFNYFELLDASAADETEGMDIDVRETHAEFDDFSDSESDIAGNYKCIAL